jgi:2-oxo-4-hydroxy-4-carboxy-5-ureidoimidazoline decarboxylase
MTCSVRQLNAMPRDAFVAALGHVVEHSPGVVVDAFDRRPFADREALAAALADAMRAAPRERQLALIRAHPELAAPRWHSAAAARELTRESTREQASAGLDRLTPDELARFRRLSDAYRARFGFPFVICVREHDKEGILASFEERLGHTPEEEVATAVEQIGRIVRLRVLDAVAE